MSRKRPSEDVSCPDSFKTPEKRTAAVRQQDGHHDEILSKHKVCILQSALNYQELHKPLSNQKSQTIPLHCVLID
ncbi:hypothetical protein PGIGA_G00197580 [Pangasianodon gigas]|uniref:Uncharacterized protein n=1 Tax=Pangasianodon gigas TaxID=30993 RepID=A0ACC5WD32_PANGG|nr:hypothetical protein [Pangasianodon gigas]